MGVYLNMFLRIKGGIDLSEMIKTAMEFDRIAREEVENAEAKKSNIHELLRERKEKIHEEYMKDVDAKVASYIQKQEDNLVSQNEQNEKDLNDAISILEKRYDEKQDDWVNTIVKNVVNAH